MPLIGDLLDHEPGIETLVDAAMDHRFDLLGSGWVQVRYGMSCAGLEGYRYGERDVRADPGADALVERINLSNQEQARALRSMISPGYRPIDWQLDFKSGFRWSEGTWYRDVTFGSVRGADIKVPWELGRLQHLPRLALAAGLAAEMGRDQRRLDLEREFRDQVLDFVSANPPRYGVQWVTAMDVAIRVANLLVAWDLFLAAGSRFDRAFSGLFARTIFEHGQHIIDNLEWYPGGWRGNHYLVDIAGLLFAAAYLPPSPTTDVWLRFGVRELVAEISHQFLDDGGNFEGSTSYHRLSAETAAYAVALVLGLPAERVETLGGEPDPADSPGSLPGSPLGPLPIHDIGDDRRSVIPEEIIDRIGLAQAFTVGMTKPDGRVPQIGDNDSGRFLDLVPSVFYMAGDEAQRRYRNLDGLGGYGPDDRVVVTDHLDHSGLVALLDGLLGRGSKSAPPARVEQAIVARLARPPGHWAALGVSDAEHQRVGDDESLRAFDARLEALPADHRRELRVELPPSSRGVEPTLVAFPAFGLYVMRASQTYVAIRCGSIGQHGRGGHDHNDQLTVELNVNGVDLLRDPGSYVYTPVPELRNTYRSVRAHFVPQLEGGEPASFGRGLFELPTATPGACVYWGRHGFAGEHRYADGRTALLLVRLDDTAMYITHAAEGARLSSVIAELGDWRDAVPDIAYSPGYGIVER